MVSRRDLVGMQYIPNTQATELNWLTSTIAATAHADEIDSAVETQNRENQNCEDRQRNGMLPALHGIPVQELHPSLHGSATACAAKTTGK